MLFPEEYKIGFIGAGNMSKAVIMGLINYGKINPKRIFVSAPSNNNLPDFEELGCITTNDNNSLVEIYKCSIIFLFVKPKVFKTNQNFFKPLKIDYPLIIVSGIAGLTLNVLYENYFGNTKLDSCKIYRIMPNLACQVGKGVCGISRNLPFDLEYDNVILQLLKNIFYYHFIQEDEMDQLTALSGSGIAFAFTFIQAMADAGVKTGLSRNFSLKVATETIMGACQMVESTKKHPIQLRDSVCSPAGTTIYGVHALEKSAFSSSVIDSVFNSFERCRNLK